MKQIETFIVAGQTLEIIQNENGMFIAQCPANKMLLPNFLDLKTIEWDGSIELAKKTATRQIFERCKAMRCTSKELFTLFNEYHNAD